MSLAVFERSPISARCRALRTWSGFRSGPTNSIRTGTPTRTMSPSVTEVCSRITATRTKETIAPAKRAVTSIRLPRWDRSRGADRDHFAGGDLAGQGAAELHGLATDELDGAVGGGEPVGDRVAVPHDAAGRLHQADEEHQAGVLDQLAGVAVGNAHVDRPPDHGGHHGLAAHPRDAEEHPHRERAPLALPEPPQQPARRPVVGDAGVIKGQDAHLSTLGTRGFRSERFSAGGGVVAR